MSSSRLRLLPLLAVVLCLASDTGAQGNEEPPIQSIHFEGVESIRQRELEDLMRTERPSWLPWRKRPSYSRPELERDMERIEARYHRRGYYEAQAEYEVTPDPESGRVRIGIRVDEGPRVVLRELAIGIPDDFFDENASGAKRSREELLDDLPLELGRGFDVDLYRDAQLLLLERLGEAGHPSAEIGGGAEVDVPEQAASVRWQIDPGPLVFLGPVAVEGLVDVEEKIVTRELAIHEGDRYSLAALERTRRRLQLLGLFRWITVAPEPTSDGAPWPVTVRLAERKPRRIQLGGGWGTDDGIRAKASWHHRNFLGGGRRLDLFTGYSHRLSFVRPTLAQPYLLDTRILMRVAPSFTREVEDAYTASRILADLDFERVLRGPWQVRAGYHFGWSDVYNVPDQDAGTVLPPEGIYFVSGPRVGLRRSTVAKPLDPQAGSWLDLSIESSLRAFGADTSFLRYTIEGRLYRALPYGVGAARLRLGTLQGIAGTRANDIPSVERFFSGGSTSMRGFQYRELSPLDSAGNPIGGSSLIEASIEWRFRLWRKLGAVVFVDAANVAADEFDWKLGNLLYAVGPGLRYDTPVGPIRLDIGWRLNPSQALGDFVVHASVGQSF